MKYLFDKSTISCLLLAIVITSVGYHFTHPKPSIITFECSPSDNIDLVVVMDNGTISVMDTDIHQTYYKGKDTAEAIKSVLAGFCDGLSIRKGGNYSFESDYHSAYCALYQQMEYDVQFDSTAKVFIYY